MHHEVPPGVMTSTMSLKPGSGQAHPPVACPAGAGTGCPAGAGGLGGIAAERRYQGSSPKPPPVWAGSRLSKVLGEAEIAFILFQSMAELTELRSVCQGRL